MLPIHGTVTGRGECCDVPVVRPACVRSNPSVAVLKFSPTPLPVLHRRWPPCACIAYLHVGEGRTHGASGAAGTAGEVSEECGAARGVASLGTAGAGERCGPDDGVVRRRTMTVQLLRLLEESC